MFDRLRRIVAAWRMRRRIAALTPDERRAIIEASPYDADYWQGEGVHVFRKGIADLDAAYVTSLGEIDLRSAEDWLIARHFEAADAGRARHGRRSSA